MKKISLAAVLLFSASFLFADDNQKEADKSTMQKILEAKKKDLEARMEREKESKAEFEARREKMEPRMEEKEDKERSKSAAEDYSEQYTIYERDLSVSSNVDFEEGSNKPKLNAGEFNVPEGRVAICFSIRKKIVNQTGKIFKSNEPEKKDIYRIKKGTEEKEEAITTFGSKYWRVLILPPGDYRLVLSGGVGSTAVMKYHIAKPK
ncbi:MAG TPA: hypothetical protein PK821_05075 [Victivallales bacterium]|nr:hypothetical protein [Victivallales bacterium]